MFADVQRVASFSAGISRYLRADLSDETLAVRLRNDLATREERLLTMLAVGIYARPTSPYLALLRHAGVGHGDIATLVRDEGLEGALLRLRDAGVHVTAEELKGQAPIVRGSLTLHARGEDFDNPFGPSGGGLNSISGGTSGTPRRLGLSINDLEEDIAYVRPWLAGAGLVGSPLVLWRGVPPGRSGLRNAFRSLRSGLVLHSWWSPTPVGFRESPRDRLALSVALGVARAHGRRSLRHAMRLSANPGPCSIRCAGRRRGRPPARARRHRRCRRPPVWVGGRAAGYRCRASRSVPGESRSATARQP